MSTEGITLDEEDKLPAFLEGEDKRGRGRFRENKEQLYIKSVIW